MKAKLFIVLSVCCFLVSLGLLVGLSGQKEAEAQGSQNDPWAIFLDKMPRRDGGGEALHYAVFGQSNPKVFNPALTCECTFTVYNVTLEEAKLGPVWTVGQDGLSGGITKYLDVVGRIVPPLGSVSITMSEILGSPTWLSDSYMIMVSWTGHEKGCKVEAVTQHYKDGNQVGSFHCCPF